VNDHEAMPYVVGELQKHKVYNFGFPGYGPHQMLSAIENGLVDCKPRIAVCQMITNHVARAAGHPSWGRHGPKYILQNGRLKHDGHFDDGTSYIGRVVSAQLERSSLYRRLLKKEAPTVTDHDIRLFLEIVDASRRRLLDDYPGVEFHVILWDAKATDRIYQKARDGLEAKPIRFHLISDILPGFPKNREKYEISAYDKHPNSMVHQLIAE